MTTQEHEPHDDRLELEPETVKDLDVEDDRAREVRGGSAIPSFGHGPQTGHGAGKTTI
jgi:hypothetical protein